MINVSSLPHVALRSFKKLPQCSAVYLILANDGDVLYVGRTKALKSRWSQGHHAALLCKGRSLRIAWIETDESDLGCVEREVIKQFNPALNIVREVEGWEPKAKEPATILGCERCGAKWSQRKKGELPIQCPRCKSLSWQKPREKK